VLDCKPQTDPDQSRDVGESARIDSVGCLAMAQRGEKNNRQCHFLMDLCFCGLPPQPTGQKPTYTKIVGSD
jgi:hypothetical protein